MVNFVKLYRLFCVRLLKPLLAKRFFNDSVARAEIFKVTSPAKKSLRVWFHASSVGELEMLMPVIDCVESELIVTAFSDSATDALEALSARLSARIGARLIFVGFAPWEGEWALALNRYEPDRFVTARYEAWPELWASLGERGIPLTIIGARARRSLSLAARMVLVLGGKLPVLRLCTTDASELGPLQRDFPGAEVQVMGDPRWERVFERAAQAHPRVQELTRLFEALPKPWGILGSAWLSDLEFLSAGFFKAPGTVWVVPHEVGAASIEELEGWLRSHLVSFVRSTAGIAQGCPQVVLVDEKGVLSELYASADWAYIGGGFGKSVHNTIEPAIHGISISCGPQGTHRFPEVDLLQSQGQLTILKTYEGAQRWRQGAQRAGRNPLWQAKARGQRGAASRITAWALLTAK